jgi:hypothetical protein
MPILNASLLLVGSGVEGLVHSVIISWVIAFASWNHVDLTCCDSSYSRITARSSGRCLPSWSGRVTNLAHAELVAGIHSVTVSIAVSVSSVDEISVPRMTSKCWPHSMIKCVVFVIAGPRGGLCLLPLPWLVVSAGLFPLSPMVFVSDW